MPIDNSLLAAIVLAAGKGKRMKSDLPKVLHTLAGKPIVEYVLDTLVKLNVDRTIMVVGYQAQRVIDAVNRPDVVFVEQKKQLGTGHAVQMTESKLKDFSGDIVVLAGDVPLLKPETIRNLLDEHIEKAAVATVLTAVLPDPTGYGRIVRDKDAMILKIVEHKDTTKEEKNIAEINTGTFIFKKAPLFDALKKINNNNSQGEYYLTDVMQIFLDNGMLTAGYCAKDYRETIGINSSRDLAQAEDLIRTNLT